MPDSLPPNVVRLDPIVLRLTTDGDQPRPPIAGIVTREAMAEAAPSVAPLVGELRTAADRLQAALEGGEPLAVTAALDHVVDLGQAAFGRLVAL